MTGFKSLNLIAAPKRAASDPTLVRREKLIMQLEQQLELTRNDQFVLKTKRWIKQDDGSKMLTERVKRVNRWWFDDSKGNCYLVVRYGNKLVELAPGKTAISVGNKSQVGGVLETVIAAVRGGELDSALSALQGRTLRLGSKPN